LDKATTGQHFAEVQQFLKVLNQLVDSGYTIPEGGDGGGEIIAEGTPEEIVKVKNSSAGKYLKDALKPKK
jgi:excinuclease ABC subunit A